MDNKSFIAGAVVGGAIGALLGILFAPAPGKETRERLGKRAQEMGGKAVNWSRTALRRGKGAGKDLDEEEEETLAGAEELESRRA